MQCQLDLTLQKTQPPLFKFKDILSERNLLKLKNIWKPPIQILPTINTKESMKEKTQKNNTGSLRLRWLTKLQPNQPVKYFKNTTKISKILKNKLEKITRVQMTKICQFLRAILLVRTCTLESSSLFHQMMQWEKWRFLKNLLRFSKKSIRTFPWN